MAVVTIRGITDVAWPQDPRTQTTTFGSPEVTIRATSPLVNVRSGPINIIATRGAVIEEVIVQNPSRVFY